jgi:hypothetical protein
MHSHVERCETLRNAVHGASWAGKTTTKRAKVHSPVSENSAYSLPFVAM